jgi:hypothetical protein
MEPAQLPEERVAEIIDGVSSYFRQERERYLPKSSPLEPAWRAGIGPYFAKNLLDRIRIVKLGGERIPTPPFYAEAKAMSDGRFPDFAHMASITYLDVLVFHEEIAPRPLFHGLVHAAQIEVLGFERYVDLYVRGFVKNRSWVAIPLEDQAYKLDARFSCAPDQAFSVEEEIKSWYTAGRYT